MFNTILHLAAAGDALDGAIDLLCDAGDISLAAQIIELREGIADMIVTVRENGATFPLLESEDDV
jgi:hypothetical protein